MAEFPYENTKGVSPQRGPQPAKVTPCCWNYVSATIPSLYGACARAVFAIKQSADTCLPEPQSLDGSCLQTSLKLCLLVILG